MSTRHRTLQATGAALVLSFVTAPVQAQALEPVDGTRFVYALDPDLGVCTLTTHHPEWGMVSKEIADAVECAGLGEGPRLDYTYELRRDPDNGFRLGCFTIGFGTISRVPVLKCKVQI